MQAHPNASLTHVTEDSGPVWGRELSLVALPVTGIERADSHLFLSSFACGRYRQLGTDLAVVIIQPLLGPTAFPLVVFSSPAQTGGAT